MNYYLQHIFLGRVLVLVALDAACLMLASWIAWVLVQPDLPAGLYVGATVVAAFLAFLTLLFCDVYRPSVIGDGPLTLTGITISMGLALPAAITFYYAVTVPEGAVACVARTATVYLPLLLIERAIFRGLYGLPSFGRRVLILGASSIGSEIAGVLLDRANAGVRLVGFLADDDALAYPGSTFAGCNVIGQIQHLEKILDAIEIHHIIVATTGRRDHFPADVLQSAKMRGCRVESGVSFLERVSGKIYLRDLHPGYMIFSEGFRTGPVGAAIKRPIDIVGASLGMILIAPVMALSALAIKLESKGPVLFKQVRLGRGDKQFVMFKLRSMEEDAEAKTGAVFTALGDPRITKTGHIMRRTRLDEFPQLLNIFRGDMTLVGPRAERPEFAESLGERYAYYYLRSSVKPGLTGWAQTRYGYVGDVNAYEEKLALDFYYLKHRSVSMDLLILWQTVKTVLLARGM